MYQIMKISSWIANKISSELGFDDDKKEVIAYGAFVLVQTIFTTIIVLLLAILFDVVLEAVLLSIVTSVLRKYSGGVHASSPMVCNIIGTFVCIGQAVLIAYLIGPRINLSLIIFTGLTIFIWAYYLIYRLAPVDSASKH